jgi:2-methylcitrate dehydratase PrpD
MANPLVYNDAAMRDPVVRDLALRIELEPDATLRADHGVFPSEVRIEVADAVYTLATKPHRGSPHNPFSWDEICEKFRRYTREILSEEQAEAVIGGIAHLEQTADMAEIARLLAEP